MESSTNSLWGNRMKRATQTLCHNPIWSNTLTAFDCLTLTHSQAQTGLYIHLDEPEGRCIAIKYV